MTSTVSTSAVVRFIQEHASKGPGSWPEPILRRWLTTRADRGELRVVLKGHRGQCSAVASIAACTEQPDGTVHVDLIIGPQQTWSGMLRTLMQRWPDWQTRRFTAVRNGCHREFPVARLIRKLEITK